MLGVLATTVRNPRALHRLTIFEDTMTFANLVEEIRALPVEAKEELKEVLEHELIDAERERLYQDHLEGVRLFQEGKLSPPTSDVNEIIRRLEE
jgi:hypothetical protein